jgi:hypothetical protein
MYRSSFFKNSAVAVGIAAVGYTTLTTMFQENNKRNEMLRKRDQSNSFPNQALPFETSQIDRCKL